MSYLLSHAILPEIAQAAKVTGKMGEKVHFLYHGSPSFIRTRLPDGSVRGPAGISLTTYWPTGRMQAASILLCEGEGDTLAAASVLCEARAGKLEPRDFDKGTGGYHVLQGLCPVGLPGVGMPARKVAAELMLSGAHEVYIALDGDDPGRRATERIVRALDALEISAIPVWLPDGKDLAECLAGFVADFRTDWLANLLADSHVAPELVQGAGI